MSESDSYISEMDGHVMTICAKYGVNPSIQNIVQYFESIPQCSAPLIKSVIKRFEANNKNFYKITSEV